MDLRKSPPEMAPVKSKSFLDILAMARMVAEFDSSVLLVGDTGAGKEMVARYIHDHSRRRDKPMLTINCAALPSTLLESELFGHKAGSFTGAFNNRVGLFEQAARGSVFLDEIGEIDGAIQVKLLRVLQEREILRIGENIPRRVDIRVIAATNVDLTTAIAENRFRKDLFFRLCVVEIRVPSLVERPEDILVLAQHFLSELSVRMQLPDLQLHEECHARLLNYSWPGNVRELYNVMERAAIFSQGKTIRAEHLSPEVRKPESRRYLSTPYIPRKLKDIEAEHIRRTLEYTGGNRPQAAKILGVSQSTLWRKLQESL
ncbi:MAG: AAA family ATPase [Candidatus Omnitrophota bacterium]|jgi:transcriptional regulator with PAS, ATPase and Fis domain|nr:MAG: AAA family ATPase [Candidatus Omnitrophota bacterium]